eukprot:CAMPEP_0113555494 /NCGR_PEP_ID=MMETSP0015_2-20120614/16744_1 /TAXON_ID=2838 /ORGANISM="Odontella" /LENGTH=260 /DNA_ID=CAMNT_0000456769 /DNA_START=54 /DNA_END=836 /DNA_ORIENTATION=+ /assembly_acc=CAM_ASM_000160
MHRSFARLLLSGILAGAFLLPPAVATNVFDNKSKTNKRSRYPKRAKGSGRCKGGDPMLDFLVCASGEAGDADKHRRDWDILRDLILLSGLDPSELEDVTFFAPDDRAFHRLAMELGYKGKYDEEEILKFLAAGLGLVAAFLELEGGLQQLVELVLLYHVADEKLPFDKLKDEIKFDTFLRGTDMEDVDEDYGRLESERVKGRRVRLVHGDPKATDPKIHNKFQDLKVEEGTVHVIKNVLIFTRLTEVLELIADEIEDQAQ